MLSVRDGELIRQPQEFLDPAISQLIPDAAAFLPSSYVSAPTQACEVSRDASLREAEQLDQLADAAFSFQQEFEDA